MTARRSIFVFLCALLAGGCARYDTVGPGRVSIGEHYSVAPAAPWSRRESRGLEYWTIDGPLLHRVVLIPGVAAGRTLFPLRGADRRRRRKLRPKFNPAMTAPEIAEFFESSMMQAGAVAFRMKRAAPSPFGTAPGFRFDFDYAVADGLDRSGFAAGAVHRGLLLMIVHLGARRHYDPAYRARVARLVGTVRLSNTGVP